MKHFYQNNYEPKFEILERPRVGLIALSTDFTIEQDFRNIFYQQPVNLYVNRIPFDNEKPTITSGIRLGSQAATTRGFGLNEFKRVGELITEVIKGLSKNKEDNSKSESEVRNEVLKLCSNFPIYNHLIKE